MRKLVQKQIYQYNNTMNRIVLKEKPFDWHRRPCDLLFPHQSLKGKRIRYYGCYGLGEYGRLALQHMQYLWLQGSQIDFYCAAQKAQPLNTQ